MSPLGLSAYCAESQCSRSSKRSVNFGWGDEKVRGLNIGGWLVLEPWITPSIFQSLDPSLGIVDEFTLTQKLGTEAALNILQPHVSPRQQMAIISNHFYSGIRGASSKIFKRLPMLDSIPSEYRLGTGPTRSMLAKVTRKELHLTWIKLSIGQGKPA